MVKKPKKTEQKIDTRQSDNLLLSGIRNLILEVRRTVVRGVNAALVWRNFEIGRRIVEYEQGDKVRAEYAEETLKALSRKLTAEFGKGYSVDNLQRMRAFYLMYKKYATVGRISTEQISQTVSGKFSQDRTDTSDEIAQREFAQSSSVPKSATTSRISGRQISQTLSAKSPTDRKTQTVARFSSSVFQLSWSHYVFLMGIGDEGGGGELTTRS